MSAEQNRVLPEEIAVALEHIHRIRGLMDFDRAAAALGIPGAVYDQLSKNGSRVNRRIVSMAAEKLELGDSSLPIGRLRFPIPRSKDRILDAARTLGLIAGISARCSAMTRKEYEHLIGVFGDEEIKFALNMRKSAKLIEADLGWPLSKKGAMIYGADLLVTWAKSATPAIARLIATALPPDLGGGRVYLKMDDRMIDELFTTVIERHWHDIGPQD